MTNESISTVRSDTLAWVRTPNGNEGAALATPSRGAREVSVVRQRQAPGGFNPHHTHDREEVMVQLSGTVTVRGASGDAQALHPGDTLVIPVGVAHRIENTGDAEAEWLLIAPAGVRFFHESGQEARPEWAR